MKEFAIPGRKPTTSRASIITGISRKEIQRVRQTPDLRDDESGDKTSDNYNRAIRVISGWVRDPQFADAHGAPAALLLEGDQRSFSQLVRQYSGDVPARAMLDELLRVGSVEMDAAGGIRLLSRAYIPAQVDEEKLSILGNDVADLIDTIGHNLESPEVESRLQLKVSYDNLPEEMLQGFRKLSTAGSRRLLELFDRELSRMDRDTNPDAQGSGRFRAGVSIYYFEEPLSETDSEHSA